MGGTDATLVGVSGRLLSTPAPDLATVNPQRLGRYGESAVLAYGTNRYLLADEGSYFVATNPAPGTVVQSAFAATFGTSVALFAFLNCEPSGGRRVYFDYIKLVAVGTGVPFNPGQFALVTDTNKRIPTSNFQTARFVPTNQDVGLGSSPCVMYYGNVNATGMAVPAPTAGTFGTSNTVARGTFVISTTGSNGNNAMLSFGSKNVASPVMSDNRGHQVVPVPPVVLAPGHCMLLHFWGTASSFSYEFEAGLWAR